MIKKQSNYIDVIINSIYAIIIAYYFYLAFIYEAVGINDLKTITFLNVMYVVYIYYYTIRKNKIKNGFFLFSFNTAYLILLLGRYISNFFNDKEYGVFIFSNISKISYLNEMKGLFLILLSIYVIRNSYSSKFRFVFKNLRKADKDKEIRIARIKSVSKVIMYVGMIAAYIKLLLRIIYVFMYGYTSTYLDNGSFLLYNPILDLLDGFYIFGFCAFLACFPKGREYKISLVLYLIYSMFTILTGVRGELVVNILFVIWYIDKRQELEKSNRKIFSNATLKLVAPFFIAIFFVFLFDYGYYRSGVEQENIGFFNKLFMFFNSQGGSGKLIALGIENEETIINYISKPMILLYPIRNYILNNSIVRIFSSGYLGQNLINLYKVGSLDSVLTYITNPTSYLNGAGLGTCYIAELMLSFGVIGVIIGSYVLGKIFNKLDNYKMTDSWLKRSIFLKAFTTFVYLPRHSMLGIIPNILFMYIFCIIVERIRIK